MPSYHYTMYQRHSWNLKGIICEAKNRESGLVSLIDEIKKQRFEALQFTICTLVERKNDLFNFLMQKRATEVYATADSPSLHLAMTLVSSLPSNINAFWKSL